MNRVTVVIDPQFNGPPGSGHGGYSCGVAAALVEGAVAEVTLRRPPPIGVELAVARDGDAASWVHDHPFPTCFGCGPERDPADALCLFCGPVGLCSPTKSDQCDGRFAVPWTPPAWTGDHGVVDPVFVWAALDCPSSAPAHGTIDAPVVLGRLTVALEGAVAVGAPHVIQSWLERTDRRKRHTGVALFTADGERRAGGRAVWVELARPLGA